MQRVNKPRVVLVTGAGRQGRVGADIARHFHSVGYNVVIHYNNAKDDAQALCDELNLARPDSAIILPADLGSDDLDRVAIDLISKAAAKWGALNVLINSASLFELSQAGVINLHRSEKLMRVNAIAPSLLTQAFSMLLGSRSPDATVPLGCVVNISDVFASNPSSTHLEYNASKKALEKITQDAAETFKNLRVAAVQPGAMLRPSGVSANEDSFNGYEGTGLLLERIMQIVNSSAINGGTLQAVGGIRAYPDNFFQMSKTPMR